MQNLLKMGVKSHEAWLKSEFYNICVFQYAYALLTFDLDLVSESHTVQAYVVLTSMCDNTCACWLKLLQGCHLTRL